MKRVLWLVLVVGCSNACPPPVVCTSPHPDYCPCLLPDMGRPDAYVEPDDAFVGDDAGIDASADDASATDAAGDATTD